MTPGAPYVTVLATPTKGFRGHHWRTQVVVDGRGRPPRNHAPEIVLPVLRIEAAVGSFVRIDMSEIAADGAVLQTYTRALVLGASAPENTMSHEIRIDYK